jgi:hypothetical protein
MIKIMLNLNNLNTYKENNRLEAKKAAGSLPQSILRELVAEGLLVSEGSNRNRVYKLA